MKLYEAVLAQLMAIASLELVRKELQPPHFKKPSVSSPKFSRDIGGLK